MTSTCPAGRPGTQDGRQRCPLCPPPTLAKPCRVARVRRIEHRLAFLLRMSGPTQLRLASLSAAAYAALAVSGTVHHLQRSGSLPAFVHGLARPSLWLLLLVAIVVAWGLWNRQVWAWWLGVAA